MKIYKNLSTSAVEAKHSEVLKNTQAPISGVVTGLTKKLDAVTWEKPSSGGAITDGVDGYQIDEGTYLDGSDSQTTILTVPAAANGADAVFTCVITSNEHTKSADKTAVNSNVFSKYMPIYFAECRSLKVFLNCEGIAYCNTRKSSSWVSSWSIKVVREAI